MVDDLQKEPRYAPTIDKNINIWFGDIEPEDITQDPQGSVIFIESSNDQNYKTLNTHYNEYLPSIFKTEMFPNTILLYLDNITKEYRFVVYYINGSNLSVAVYPITFLGHALNQKMIVHLYARQDTDAPTFALLYSSLKKADKLKNVGRSFPSLPPISPLIVSRPLQNQIVPYDIGEHGSPARQEKYIKGLMFDFDNTLTNVHVYGNYCKYDPQNLFKLSNNEINALWSTGTLNNFINIIDLSMQKGIHIAIGSYGNRSCIYFAINKLLPGFSQDYIYTPSMFVLDSRGLYAVKGTTADTNITPVHDGNSMDEKRSMVAAYAKDIYAEPDEIILIDDDENNVISNPNMANFKLSSPMTKNGIGLTDDNYRQLRDYLLSLPDREYINYQTPQWVRYL
jgi:hypothetical protein